MPLRFTMTLNGENQEWTLEKFPARLGRSSSNAIQLLDGTVSKEHAEIVRDGSALDGARPRQPQRHARQRHRRRASRSPIQPGDRSRSATCSLRVTAETAGTDACGSSTAAAWARRSSMKVRGPAAARPAATQASTRRVVHAAGRGRPAAGAAAPAARDLRRDAASSSSRRCPRLALRHAAARRARRRADPDRGAHQGRQRQRAARAVAHHHAHGARREHARCSPRRRAATRASR